MIILKPIYICIITLIIIVIFKKISPEFVPLVAIISGILVLSYILPYLNTIINTIKSFRDTYTFASDSIGICIKIVGISLMCEFASELCNDSGEGYLSSNISFAGKIIILAIVSPVIVKFISRILNMINEL